METIRSLKPEALYNRCDPDQFAFETTSETEDLTEIIGQERAMNAVKFGVGIKQDGYNLFALGSSSIAKRSVIGHFLKQKAAAEPVPPDWCYINNFDETYKPHALSFPPGSASAFRQDIERLVEELVSAIPSVFESEDYRTRKQAIEEEFKEKREKAFEDLQQRAEARGVALMRTPAGVVFAPLRKGEVLSPEEFQSLPKEEQERTEKEVFLLQEELRKLVQQAPQWEKQSREKIRALNDEVTTFAVEHLIDEAKKKYENLPDVVKHLSALQQDVIKNASVFLKSQTVSDEEFAVPEASQADSKGLAPFLRRYKVNVVVDNSATKGAPVVFEDNPAFQSLVGQIEHIAYMGSLVTDFNLIKAGALHKANGGYLMIDVYKLLTQPYAWEGFKRALRAGEIRIESLGQMLSLVSTVSLEPEPIPLDVKVVLFGEPMLYYLLCRHDPEFGELFKVAVDFNETMDRTPESALLYARLIGKLARKEKLRPFDRRAVARVIEQSSRMCGDSEKFSAHMKSMTDLLREADYWAGEAGRKTVAAEDVQRAVDAWIGRNDRIRELIGEEIRRGDILIDLQGAKIGQINGLSVIDLGKFAFGRPSRITARVRLGKGEVIDIERQVEMGGPIHSKGVLILSSFLGARYSAEDPLSLSASLVFEQSYSGVEGDSASSAELYALLSALAEAPIKQSLAVTGSVNQYGQVQAIGGVNEKIEGFFDICRATGLTGDQGVLIPASNVKHLMLRRDVVDAVREGKFHVYSVETIDQGIEILTGLSAGEKDETGKFPEGSLNFKVEARLNAFAEKRIALGRDAKKEGE